MTITTCPRRIPRLGWLARSMPPLVVAAVAVVSLAGPSSSDADADRGDAVRSAGVVTTAAAAGSGSWGYPTEDTPVYAQETGSGPRSRPIDYLSPYSIKPGIYAYCKTPLPGTSLFQYRAAVPTAGNEFNPSYRVAWVRGGAIRFTRLMDIPRC